MRIVINISKTHARILSALLFIIIVGISADYVSSAAPGLTQWHILSEITNDTNGNVRITTASGKINSSFIDGGVGGGWTDDGTNVYLTTSTDNVGIGTTIPEAKLDVAGPLKLLPMAQPFACGASKKGALYFDSGTSKHMMCNGASWVDYTGPQGPTGATGPQGPVGPSGASAVYQTYTAVTSGTPSAPAPVPLSCALGYTEIYYVADSLPVPTTVGGVVYTGTLSSTMSPCNQFGPTLYTICNIYANGVYLNGYSYSSNGCPCGNCNSCRGALRVCLKN